MARGAKKNGLSGRRWQKKQQQRFFDRRSLRGLQTGWSGSILLYTLGRARNMCAYTGGFAARSWASSRRCNADLRLSPSSAVPVNNDGSSGIETNPLHLLIPSRYPVGFYCLSRALLRSTSSLRLASRLVATCVNVFSVPPICLHAFRVRSCLCLSYITSFLFFLEPPSGMCSLYIFSFHFFISPRYCAFYFVTLQPRISFL